jgi:hypothetical protein
MRFLSSLLKFVCAFLVVLWIGHSSPVLSADVTLADVLNCQPSAQVYCSPVTGAANETEVRINFEGRNAPQTKYEIGVSAFNKLIVKGTGKKGYAGQKNGLLFTATNDFPPNKSLKISVDNHPLESVPSKPAFGAKTLKKGGKIYFLIPDGYKGKIGIWIPDF